MKIVSKFKGLILVGIITAFFVVSTGCSRHPNEEQIRVLEEARSAALAAEQKLADKRQECSDLENQLAQKKDELAAVKQEREDIKKRLENWTEE
jgi:septal ring factor EnvC (AmiA/AmiB activator)